MNRYMYLTVAAALAVGGCSQAPSTESESAMNEPLTVESPVAEMTETIQPIRYNEFVWCTSGENGNAENVAARNAYWANAVSEIGMEALVSASLTPQGWSSDSFDRLTLLMWPDKEARDAGWAAYAEAGIEAELNTRFAGVEACGGENWANVYGLDVYQPRTPTVSGVDTITDSAYTGYSFCSFNEGKEPADLRAVVTGPFMTFVDDFEAEAGPNSFNFLVQLPDFEETEVELHEAVPPTFDFVWTSFYGNETDRALTEAVWAEKGAAIQAQFDEVVTCSEEQGYDIEIIKQAAI